MIDLAHHETNGCELQSDPEIVLLDAARTWAKVTSAGWFVAGAVFGAAVAGKAWGVRQ